MLIDPKMFQVVENALLKNGAIARYENALGDM